MSKKTLLHARSQGQHPLGAAAVLAFQPAFDAAGALSGAADHRLQPLLHETAGCPQRFQRGRAYTYLYDNYTSYGAASGFSADVMTAAISRDQITADMESAVTRLYKGDTALDARDAIQTSTYENLIADLDSRGIEVTQDIASAVDIVADACRQDYSNYSCHSAGQPAVHHY